MVGRVDPTFCQAKAMQLLNEGYKFGVAKALKACWYTKILSKMVKKKPLVLRPRANPSFEAMEETIGAVEFTLIANQSLESMTCE